MGDGQWGGFRPGIEGRLAWARLTRSAPCMERPASGEGLKVSFDEEEEDDDDDDGEEEEEELNSLLGPRGRDGS